MHDHEDPTAEPQFRQHVGDPKRVGRHRIPVGSSVGGEARTPPLDHRLAFENRAGRTKHSLLAQDAPREADNSRTESEARRLHDLGAVALRLIQQLEQREVARDELDAFQMRGPKRIEQLLATIQPRLKLPNRVCRYECTHGASRRTPEELRAGIERRAELAQSESYALFRALCLLERHGIRRPTLNHDDGQSTGAPCEQLGKGARDLAHGVPAHLSAQPDHLVSVALVNGIGEVVGCAHPHRCRTGTGKLLARKRLSIDPTDEHRRRLQCREQRIEDCSPAEIVLLGNTRVRRDSDVWIHRRPLRCSGAKPTSRRRDRRRPHRSAPRVLDSRRGAARLM